MSRRTKKLDVDESVTLHSTELEFCAATDLLADMTMVAGPAIGAWKDGSVNKGEAIAMLARELVGGRLSAHLTRLLACTTLIAKDGDKPMKVENLDSREKLNKAFTGRQKYIGAAVKLALEVSFVDFLGALALAGLPIPNLSSSESSTQTTTDIG